MIAPHVLTNVGGREVELAELASMLGGTLTDGATIRLFRKPEGASVLMISGKDECVLSLSPTHAVAVCATPSGERMYVFEREKRKGGEVWKLVRNSSL